MAVQANSHCAALKVVDAATPFTSSEPEGRLTGHSLPALLTPDEVATLLRTSRKAVYCMADRGQLPGKTRIGRRVLFRTRHLVDYLDRKCAPSPKENRR
jgi:excisionase family DNA binding protein